MDNLPNKVPEFSYHEADLLHTDSPTTTPASASACEETKISLNFDAALRELWDKKMDQGLFRYKLPNPVPAKILPGKYNFVLQLNLDRAQKRRKAQNIEDVNQPFNNAEFNFNRVNEDEILLQLRPWWNSEAEHDEHMLIINVSPIDYGHILLTPFRNRNNTQRISAEGLRMAVELLFLNKDRDFRIGFNSLGGYASVNHEHYHGYYLRHRLYIETACLQSIGCDGSTDVHELIQYPAPAFVYVLHSPKETEKFVKDVVLLTEYLQTTHIAHNVFVTWGNSKDSTDVGKNQNPSAIRLFIWARKPSYGAKECDAFNPALCEFGGHFPCKSAQGFESLTEDWIISFLGNLCCDKFNQLRQVIKSLIKS